MMVMAKDDYLPVGKISGLFGVRGWVKIYSYTQPRDNILNYSPWYFWIDGRWQAFQLADGKAHGKGVVALLQGLDDRDAAAALIDTEIAITRGQLPPPEEGEFYWADMEGLRVVNTEHCELGVVDHFMETGANDVMVVSGERERLIPFIRDQVIIKVDIAGGYVVVDWDADF